MLIAIVVGTRPEIIRLSAIIKRCRQTFKSALIHTGQNYDYNLNEVFFQDLKLDPPDYYLDCNKQNVGSCIGDIISKSYNLFQEIKPDALVVLGDTNSCLCAYSAKRLKIPIFHVEAGNRCFDPNVPEEINRKLIDHLADINMCYMEHARRNLLQEGLKSQYIFVVGTPMREVLDSLQPSSILQTLNLEPKSYFLISFHREENVNNENKFLAIINSINNLVMTYQKKIIISVHPRTRKMLNEKEIVFDPLVILSDPFGFIDYCCLQQNASCVISDSGTLTEECSILKFPAVLLRNSTEHPEGIEAGNIIIGNVNWSNLKLCIDIAMKKTTWLDVDSYADSNVSEKVCMIILSYVEIINKFLWMK